MLLIVRNNVTKFYTDLKIICNIIEERAHRSIDKYKCENQHTGEKKKRK